MKLLILALIFASFSFSQEKTLSYRDTVRLANGTYQVVNTEISEQESIESTENSLTDLDSLKYLKTVSIFAMDSVNVLRRSNGLDAIPLDEQYLIDFEADVVHYYMDSVKIPILVKTITMKDCESTNCHREILEEVFFHQTVMDHLLCKKLTTFRIVVFRNDGMGLNYCIETHKLKFSIEANLN